MRRQTGVHVCACVCGVTCAGVCAHVRVCRRQVCTGVCVGVRVRGHVCRRVRTCARACQRQVRAGQVCGGRALASLRTSICATAAHRGLGEESLTRPAELGGTCPRCGGSRSACADTVFLEDVSLIRYSKTPHV